MGKGSRFILAAVGLNVILGGPGNTRAAPNGGLVLVVNTEDDEADDIPGDGRCATMRARCTLRAAIQEANAHPGRDRVSLPPGFYHLRIEGAGEDAAATGDLDITDDLTVEGADTFGTGVEGGSLDQVFHVHDAANVELRGLTVSGGLAAPSLGSAGGILNRGTLVLSHVLVASNVAATPFAAGGLNNQGTASIEHSIFQNNVGDAILNDGNLELFETTLRSNGPGFAVRSDCGGFTMRSSEILDQTGSGVLCQGGPTLIERSSIRRTRPGGAILIPSAMVTVRDSLIEGNEGGGINNDGVLVVERSTLRANSRFDFDTGAADAPDTGEGAGLAGATAETGVTNTDASYIYDSVIVGHRGGGVVNEQGRVTLVNVTVSGNSAPIGAGGVTNSWELVVRSSTITGNHSEGGFAEAGGLAAFEDSIASVRLSNTIIAGNTSSTGAPDCFGPITSEGHNLIGDSRGCGGLATADGDLLDVNAALGPLADNGGPTLTHALLGGSAAIDAGSTAPAGSDPGACPERDQRGAGRPQGARCDIGAFELATSCGDGVLDSGETCDDGNVDPGDCCSPLCSFEPLAGDCDASGAVEIEELLRVVAIALGNVPLEECAVADIDGDGRLSIGEILQAVQSALAGCRPTPGAARTS